MRVMAAIIVFEFECIQRQDQRTVRVPDWRLKTHRRGPVRVRLREREAGTEEATCLRIFKM